MKKSTEDKINLIKKVLQITGKYTYIITDNEPYMQDPTERKEVLNYWRNHGFRIHHRRHLGYVLT